MSRVLASGPGNWVPIPGRVIPKTQKWSLMPPCLTLRYGSREKWSNPGKEVAPSPSPWCSSYRKRSLRVTLNYSRQLYLVLDIGIMVSMFANGPGDLGSIPGRVIPKTQKWYLMPPCLTLTIIRYRSREKCSNPVKGVAPSQHLGVVAIEKGTFGSSLTVIANFTYFINLALNNPQRLICQKTKADEPI